MNRDQWLATCVIFLGGLGTWLLLPHKHGKIKARLTQGCGAALSILALLLLSAFYTSPGPFLPNVFFWVFATSAVGSGILTITSRNPVYSALWFASVVLSTSGLFLLAGASFLAAGTIIVYAGAIIVTFLFVIMLAQSEGQALYDRMARAPGAATLSGFALLWAVFYALLMVRSPGGDFKPVVPRLTSASEFVKPTLPGNFKNSGPVLPGSGPAFVLASAIRPTALLADDRAPAPKKSVPHVAALGATLFTDHLIAVEVAGTLLFIALVGAISMATPRTPIRPVDREAISAGDPAQARALANMTN
ncbi:MAG: NADH:ubiquinone oxidoreductase subunit 6 [Planctomycetota bacterium]|nr:NADH:ubiquinone oxidoreductase subunit 6 [Planctomycetota bacterium]